MRHVLLWPVGFVADLAADLLDDIRPYAPPDIATGFVFNAPGPASCKPDLTPKQISWCDKHLGHFKMMREQAEKSKRGK